MNKVCAIGLLAYDYELLLKTMPAYLTLVDQVILGLDRRRLTWSGNKFEVPDSFFERLKSLDTEKKVKIVEDDFCIEGVNPLELETRERNILSKHAPEDAWLLSVDADEYLLQANDLISFLREFSDNRVNLYGNWITLFKQSGKDMFVIENGMDTVEHFPLATMKSEAFTYGRSTKQRVLFTSTSAIHYSWARTKEEVERKLLNWGHRDDFNFAEFVSEWDLLDASNYKKFVNFHPAEPHLWEKLALVNEDHLEEYAKQKSIEWDHHLAWKSVPTQARLGLFEEKVAARDAATAAMKKELEQKIEGLTADLERCKAELEQMGSRKAGLFAGLFKNKE